ncbi:MAG: hypothetical protein L0Z50_19125 [Verrucomicrobiales bacterium]|nr:hypothetical protein [Verrucomicrobiales bacterium]
MLRSLSAQRNTRCVIIWSACLLMTAPALAQPFNDDPHFPEQGRFYQLHLLRMGMEHGNPKYNENDNWFRINSPNVSLMKNIKDRYETRYNGLMMIRADADITALDAAELSLEVWGGHPGTHRKRVTVNGRSTYALPEVGSARNHCTHSYLTVPLKLSDLVNGYNAFQFACEKESGWGHFIVHDAWLKLQLPQNHPTTKAAGLQEFRASVHAEPVAAGEAFRLVLDVPERYLANIATAAFQAFYDGYDENGNGLTRDWHGLTQRRQRLAWAGETNRPPFSVIWDISMLPAQREMAVRALVQFKEPTNVVYLTAPLVGLQTPNRAGQRVTLHAPTNIPVPFWSRASRKMECDITVEVAPEQIEKATLHIAVWGGGAGTVKEYFKLNGHFFPVAPPKGWGPIYYHQFDVPREVLRQGANHVELLSDSEHHGIEVLLPGPALTIRSQTKSMVIFTEAAVDASAGGLPAYKIETPLATYFLEKSGAGLSSLLDQDGNDWLGFHPEPGSGAGGEYRGFPNAVHQQSGNYFHPKNDGTDRAKTRVERVAADYVSILAESESGHWAGRYEFHPTHCTFTVTRLPEDQKYWVLYEGTPGGEFRLNGWWMTSAINTPQPMTKRHEGDIPAPEWMAFGDSRSNRSLVLFHHEDDDHPDTFYQMHEKMTVFGFGRKGLTKYLSAAGQRFSIGLIETNEHEAISRFINQVRRGSQPANNKPLGKRHDWKPVTSPVAKRRIEIWYGNRQRFGHLGEPQRWVNVLGSVPHFRDLKLLSWGLDGGAPKPLKIGGDLHRLTGDGDFNIEIPWEDLPVGDHRLEITATYSGEDAVRTNVHLQIEHGQRWPLPYQVDFSRVKDLQDVVQIVDGEWKLTRDGVRTAQAGYDRVLALGDNSWTNFEATVRVTLHGFMPPMDGPPTYRVTHVGIALRWRGHTADGKQPSRQWYPLGAQGEYLIRDDLSQSQYRILRDEGKRLPLVYGAKRRAALNQPFWLKARVTTLPDGRTHYHFKTWNFGEAEPDGWAVDATEEAATDYPSGSLCLVPHCTDVTIHEVNVVAIEQ